MMRITFKAESMQLRQPRMTTRGQLHTRTRYLIRLEDHLGRIGWGEAFPIWGLSPDAQNEAEFETKLHQHCQQLEKIGEMPEDFAMDSPAIRFGLEGALLTCGKQPLAPIWDTAFSRGEAGIALHHLIWMSNWQEMQQQAEQGIEQGYTCLKMKITAADWDRQLQFLRTLHREHPQLELRGDANGALSAYSATECHRKLEQLYNSGLRVLEQACAVNDEEKHAQLLRENKSGIRLALDESLIGCHSRQEKEKLLDTLAAEALVLKPTVHGGIRGCEQWLELAEERNMDSWSNSMLESHLGQQLIAEWSAYRMPDCLHGISKGGLYRNEEKSAYEIREAKLWRAK